MDLRRLSILIVACLLALVGILVPVFGMLWITWSLALSDERALLESAAQRVLLRTERAISDARLVFEEMASTRAEPCSQAHVDLMRRLVFNTRTVEEIGFFDEGRLTCTSWGRIDETIPFQEPDFLTAEGIGLTLGVRPALPGGAPKLALNSGSYNVLVDPLRFVDILAEPQIEIGLATRSGLVVARTGDLTDEWVQGLAATLGSVDQGNFIHSAVRSANWTAIAAEPRPTFFSTLRREQLILLPIGLLLAGMLVSLIVWQSRQRLSLRAEIATAIRNKKFVVHYQPIMELVSGLCVGAEALVRWRRPDGSWVRPDLFIPAAEDAGLIGDITRLVIANVGSDIGGLLADNSPLHISINLAREDLRTDVALGHLVAMTTECGIAPSQIWLEVTERGFVDYDSASDTIARLRALGYRLSIDDFGTGYSSLNHLQRVDFDTLKMDKSFVDTIGIASAKSAVIFHIIEMAKALSVTIIAEGVERQEQADYLEANGVPLAQGWLYARALPAAEFEAFYRTHATRDPSMRSETSL